MNTLLTYLDLIAPSFFALLAIACFRKRTRLLCYITVLLAICAELIPLTINTVALSVCVASLVAIIVADAVRAYMSRHPQVQQRILEIEHRLLSHVHG
jgi:hypothetical protein